MEKIFVLIPYMGKTDEQIQGERDRVLALYAEVSGREAELCIPHGKRLTGDINAMFESDLVVAVKYYEFDPVCQIVQLAANVYGKTVVEDRHIDDVVGQDSNGEEPEGGESE